MLACPINEEMIAAIAERLATEFPLAMATTDAVDRALRRLAASELQTAQS